MALSSSWIELLNGTLFSSQPQSDTVYLILIVVSLTAVLLFFTAFAFSLFAVRWRHNVFNKLWPSRTLLSCCIALTAASIFLWYPLPGPIPFPPVNVSLGHRNLSIRKVLCIASVGGTVGVFSPLVSAITYFSLWGLLRNGQRLDPSTILKSSSLVWLAAVLSQGAVTSVTAIFLDEQYSGIFEYFVAGTGVCRMPVTNLALYITYDAVLTSLSYSKCHKLAASHTKNVVYTKRMKELGWSLLIFAFIEYLLLAIGELLAISSQAVLQEKDASVVMLVQAVMSSTALLFLLLRETVVLVVLVGRPIAEAPKSKSTKGEELTPSWAKYEMQAIVRKLSRHKIGPKDDVEAGTSSKLNSMHNSTTSSPRNTIKLSNIMVRK